VGDDKIRHVSKKPKIGGAVAYHWTPSRTLAKLGLCGEALGTDWNAAKKRAIELNNLADDLRRHSRHGDNGPAPGSISRLIRDYRASDEFADLKPRTQRDYNYYLDKIDSEWARTPVRAMSARVIKIYYKRVRREVSVTWAYHILGTLRTLLSWAVSEDWIVRNPALDVSIKSPPKRTVTWEPGQAALYIAQARKDGWLSIVAMAYVFDSIAQSPIDVRTLKAKAYDGERISNARIKTGRTDAPIRLFPEAKAALDEYLATRPPLLPEASLFTNEKTGVEWVESTLAKYHGQIRKAAGLPKKLQLQDFRRTAQTEGGAAGGTVDEIRGLARHSTRSAAEHYVHPDERYVESIQQKRLALRNKTGAKVGSSDT
jgi:site-specific recombinase XerD